VRFLFAALFAILTACFTTAKPKREVLIISPMRAKLAEKMCKRNHGLNVATFTKSAFSCNNGARFYK
jgi:hypothetical protein